MVGQPFTSEVGYPLTLLLPLGGGVHKRCLLLLALLLLSLLLASGGGRSRLRGLGSLQRKARLILLLLGKFLFYRESKSESDHL